MSDSYMKVLINDVSESENKQTGEIQTHVQFSLHETARCKIKNDALVNVYSGLKGRQVLMPIERGSMTGDNGRVFEFWKLLGDGIPVPLPGVK